MAVRDEGDAERVRAVLGDPAVLAPEGPRVPAAEREGVGVTDAAAGAPAVAAIEQLAESLSAARAARAQGEG
jgi:Flp pilus assembly CpaE family ATPase